METEINLHFDAFLAKVGVIQIGHSSNQRESGEIYQSFWTSSLFPIPFHLSPNII